MKNEAWEEGFYTGVIAALLVLVYDKQESLCFEILKTCGDKEIKRIAKREGDTAIVKLVNGFRSERRATDKYWTKKAA